MGFPAQSKGSIRKGEQLAPIAAIDNDLTIHLPQLSGSLHKKGADPQAVTLNGVKTAIRPPLQQGFSLDPVLKNRLCSIGLVAEATHPVVIQALGFTPFQFPQEGTPKTRLPGGEFIAIGATNPCCTDHATQPRTRREQKRLGTTTGGLEGSSYTASATAPHHNIATLLLGAHRKMPFKPSLSGSSGKSNGDQRSDPVSNGR